MSKTDSKSPVDAILSILAGRSDAQAILAEVTARLAPTSLPADDAAFAARVLAAARASKTGRFGRDKVFISHVERQLAREGVAIGDVDAFRARLVACHRADENYLTLHRADLVEAMSPADVSESTTRYRTAEFHFINIGR